jgi:hypothetical protein
VPNDMPENAGETHVKTFETSKKLQIFHEVPKFPRKCPKFPEYSGILEQPKIP